MLTPSDKQVIAEYMGWFKHIYFYKYDEPIYFQEGVAGDIVFDLNDAGLCVEKMMENGDWEGFIKVADKTCDNKSIWMTVLIAWLFNPDNFFSAMAAWLMGSEAAA